MMPQLPPYSVFDAPTEIRVDGHPPTDMLLRIRSGNWPGRILIASGYRQEELWDAVEGHWGAAAILSASASGALPRSVRVASGDLQEAVARMLSGSCPTPDSGTSGRETPRFSRSDDAEVIAVLLPESRRNERCAAAVAEWLELYLSGDVSRQRVYVGPDRADDESKWISKYISCLATILWLRNHVTLLTKHLSR